MKKLKHLWILILLFGLVSISACGKPEEEPVNQEVVVDCAETMAANQYLLIKQEELEGTCQRLLDNQAEYINAVRTLEDANLALGIELALMKSLEAQKAEGYEDLINEVVSLRAERKDWGILASQEYSRILEEYNELAAVYPPRDFKDTEELEVWLEEDETDYRLTLIADEDGEANFDGKCEEFALQLMQHARESGYIMSFYPMGSEEYYTHYEAKMPVGKLHAVNLVIIGNDIYLIEPQTDEYWLMGHLD